MGLLDDAIREHLDLKRRSGGDPAEIERLEREALGPVRREPTAVAEATVAPAGYDYDDQEDELEDVPHAEIVGTPPERQPKRRGFLHRRPASLSEPEPGIQLEGDEIAHRMHEPWEHLEPHEPHEPEHLRPHEPDPPPLSLAGQHDDDLSGGSADPTHSRVSPVDDATVEHRAVHGFDEDESRAAESAPEVDDEPDDVLEETPEFLQDTPDHDRLWFEQRPPKDFDFDG